MTTSDLSILTFIATAALFIVSHLERRSTNENSKLRIATRGVAVIVLLLTAAYFYKRFTG